MDLADLHSVRPLEQSLSHVDALPVGSRLAEFELQGLIGVGGFGMVYRAFDHNLQRPVAIKEYLPSAMAFRKGEWDVAVRSPSDGDAYAAGLAAFVNEARLLARFDHPSLVKVLRFWEAHGTAYMVMPLYKGVTLKQARGLLDEPPSELWLRKVLWSVLQALKLLHDRQIIHRDISPDNILLQDIGPPVLLDLGAARKVVDDHLRRNTAVLKVNYAPIEQYAQADDLTEGPWTDLYSLAAVIYGLVKNEPPEPATFRAMRDRMPSMVEMSKTIRAHFGRVYTREFAAGIDRAMRVQPSDRPQSVAAFIDVLQLKTPDGVESFDWWREAEEAELAAVPHRRWGLWNRRTRSMGSGGAWQPSRDGWRDTRHRESVQRDFEHSRAEAYSRSSVLDFGNTVVPPVPRRGVRRLRRAGMLMGVLALGVATLLMVRNVDQGSAVQASGKPAATMAAASRTDGVPKAKADGAAGQPRRALEQAKPRDESRDRTLVVRATPKPSPQNPAEPVAAAASVVVPERRKASVVVELCADSSFFARPMCIYQECQKPENAKQPVCVEERQREEANARAAGRI